MRSSTTFTSDHSLPRLRFNMDDQLSALRFTCALACLSVLSLFGLDIFPSLVQGCEFDQYNVLG